MVEVHRFVVDRYSQKFPELDSLIPQPADYVRTVQVMRNEMVRSMRVLIFSGATEQPVSPIIADNTSRKHSELLGLFQVWGVEITCRACCTRVLLLAFCVDL